MIDLVFHEVIRVIGEAGWLELGTAAGVLSRHLEVDDGPDSAGMELLDKVNALYLRGVGPGHGQDVLGDPVAVDTPECHISPGPGRAALILTPGVIQ